MLEMVQHTIETSVEEVSGGFLPPSFFHERSRAAKLAVGTAVARFVNGFALALAVIAGVSAASGPVAAGQSPAEFISVIGADVLQEMRADVPLAQKEDYFRQMLRMDADLEGISRFVLGPYWRIASAEQRQEFEKLFEDYLIRSDGPLLVQHSGGTFRVTGSRTNPAGMRQEGWAPLSKEGPRSLPRRPPPGHPIIAERRDHGAD